MIQDDIVQLQLAEFSSSSKQVLHGLDSQGIGMGRGTGLGLSVSFGIINDTGGTLGVENIGEGAKFVITLPIADKAKLKAKADAMAV